MPFKTKNLQFNVWTKGLLLKSDEMLFTSYHAPHGALDLGRMHDTDFCCGVPHSTRTNFLEKLSVSPVSKFHKTYIFSLFLKIIT